MAEFIFIPLRNIQNLLPEVASSKIRGKLEELHQSLLLIQVQQDEDHQRRLIDLVYKVDDEIDTISLVNRKSYGRSVSNGMISGALKSISAAYHENRAARGIGSLVRSVKNNILARSTDPWNWNEQRSKQHDHHSYDIEEHFVEITGDLASCIKYLTSESSRPFVEICGEDGSGKTIVVKRIYNNIYIRRYFQAFAWITLRQRQKEISEVDLFSEILKQLLSYDKKGAVILMLMEEKELINELKKVLEDYKCLVVIDGITDDLPPTLVTNLQFIASAKSKVLLLTRLYMGIDPLPSQAISWVPLTKADGWKLLKMITFGNQEKGELIHQFEKIGRELVEMCDGKPLLISILGRVLSENKFSIDHWKMVEEHIKSPDRTSDSNWKILALSYDRLPIHLRASFLYLGLFPEDEDINAEMLYQMWIAEGLVSSHLCVGEEATMDVAEEYLAELANRFLVHVQQCDFSIARRLSSFCIHDVVRKFCLKPKREWITYEEFEIQHVLVLEYSLSQDDWLSLNLRFSKKIFLENVDFDVTRELTIVSEKLRSLLICYANGVWRAQISFPHDIYKKFKLLRVLRIENFEIKDGKLPRDIRNLIHLRFLSLKDSAFEELPSSIGKFQFLETLDLRVAEIFPRGIVVPNVLWKLKRLRHLYLPACHHAPKGEGKLSLLGLSKLETLVNFDNEKDELTDSEWTSLRCIDARVYGKKKISDVIDCINNHGHKLKETFLHASFSNSSLEESKVPLKDVLNCSKLHHLMVTWGRCELKEFNIPSSSSNLIELCFMRCQIKEDPMPTLGKFPHLRKLVLGKKSFMGKDMKCESNSFPVLKSLKITYLMHLQKLEIPEGSMPSLSCLEIVCCHKLKMIPEGLTMLKELKLRMPKEFNDRVRVEGENEGEDFHKVRNVPFIFLEDW